MKKICFISFALSSCVCLNMFAQQISSDKTFYQLGDSVNLSFKDVAIGSNVYLYQNASLVPLRKYLEDITYTTDNLLVGGLESGYYTARNEFEEQSISTLFTVANIPQNHSDLSVFVMTDIHVMAQSLIQQKGSAFDNAVNNNRKMIAESEGIYNQLIDSIIQFRPDLVLIPGDLTKDGEKLSHNVVIAGLDKLRANNIPTLVVPGNHDYLNPNSAAYNGDEQIYSPTITEQEFAELYKNYGYSNESVREPDGLSYYIDIFPKLRIIAIDATRNRENKVIGLGDSINRSFGGGLMRESTLNWVLSKADEAKDNLGRQVIVMMHHQLLQHFNNQDKVFSSASIQSGDSIANLFIEHGIQLVFTGHMHINNITKYYNTAQTDSLVEISTGSTIEYPSCWRWIGINSNRDEVTVNTRYINKTAETDNLLVYGRDKLAEHTELLWSPIANMMWNTMRTLRNSTFKTDLTVGKFLDILLSNKAGYSDLAYTYMKEPIMLTMLTTSEANENLKYHEMIIDMMATQMMQFADIVMTNNGFNWMERLFVNTALTTVSNSMFDEYLGSLLTDCSYCGKQNENTTNDLYLSIKLAAPKEVTGLTNITNDDNINYFYDLLGRKYRDCPTEQGIYIHNGKKIFIR